VSEKVCKNCRRIVSGDSCAACGGTQLSKTYEGYILLLNVEGSEIAKEIGASSPGKFALKIK
jgi:DNA-directed RNA polymerase subunit E"